MTVKDVSPPADPVRRWRPWTTRLILIAGVTVVVLGVLALHRSKSWQPRAFVDEYGRVGGYSTKAARAASTYFVTITDPRAAHRGSVTLHGAAPHGLADSTGASFSYFLCTPGSERAEPTGIMSAAEERQWCRSMAAADDAQMSLTGQQILVAVTPGRAGVVVFHGLDIHYSQDGHSGAQLIGPDVRIRAK